MELDSIVIEEIEKELERLYGKDSVIELTREGITDFQRGKIEGQILSLQKIMSLVAHKTRVVDEK